jgi:hypothetical protein
MTNGQKEALMREVVREHERGKSYRLPILADLQEALVIISNMLLALRHPGARDGSAARSAREIIDLVIARIRQDGFVAVAQLMELGNDPGNDE